MKPANFLVASSLALFLWACASPGSGDVAPSQTELTDYRFGPSPFFLSNWASASTTAGIEGRARGTLQGQGRRLALRLAGPVQLRSVANSRVSISGLRFVLAGTGGEKIAQTSLIPLSEKLDDDRHILNLNLPSELRIDLEREPAGAFAPGLANAHLRMDVITGDGAYCMVHGPLTLIADLYTPGGHAAACARAATLNEAMGWNCAARLRELLAAGADPEMANAFMEPPPPENLTTPLEHAVESGDIALMRRLLYYGADSNRRGQDYTAFELAVVLGRADAIEPLLRSGAQLSAVGPHGFTPLMLAAQFNHPDIVRALLRAGADPDQPVPHRSPRGDGRTALMHALEEEKSEVRRLLLDAGANPLHPTADGFSPFLYASEHPRMHAFKEFLARGYPVNASTEQGFFAGKTPFMSVAVRSRREDLDELVRLGADPRLKDRSGNDALYWTRRFGREENAQWIERWLAARS